jgi:hypothetical protein
MQLDGYKGLFYLHGKGQSKSHFHLLSYLVDRKKTYYAVLNKEFKASFTYTFWKKT